MMGHFFLGEPYSSRTCCFSVLFGVFDALVAFTFTDVSKRLLWGGQEAHGRACEIQSDRIAQLEFPVL
jgi:hypothetical protein